MDVFLNNIAHFSQAIYEVIFFGMFVEANVTTLGSSVLISYKILNPFFIVCLVIAGAFAEQYALYFLGRGLSRSKFLEYHVNRLVAKYDGHFTHKTFRSLLVSKFIFGLHRAVLIRCGMLKISLKHFTAATLRSTTIWLLFFFILGFIFSASYNSLKHYLKYGELALLIVSAIIFVLEYSISKRLQKDL